MKILNILFKSLMVLALMLMILFLLFRNPDKSLEELKLKYTTETSQWIDIMGMNVHYRVEGTGEPIVLLHGTSSSLHTWDGWTGELKEEHKIYRMDLPAFGLTGAHPKRDYTIKGYVEFVDKFVEEMSLDSFTIAGNSLGGNIAWAYTVDHPEKVDQLILLDASGYPHDQPIEALAFQIAKNPILSPLLKHITPKSFVKKNLLQVYGDDSKVTADIVDLYHDITLREGNRQAFIDRVHTVHKDRSAEIPKISCPTLILWGEEDTWVQPSDADQFHRDIPNSKLITYPGVGHIPMEEIPIQTAKDVKEFLKSY